MSRKTDRFLGHKQAWETLKYYQCGLNVGSSPDMSPAFASIQGFGFIIELIRKQVLNGFSGVVARYQLPFPLPFPKAGFRSWVRFWSAALL